MIEHYRTDTITIHTFEKLKILVLPKIMHPQPPSNKLLASDLWPESAFPSRLQPKPKMRDQIRIFSQAS